MNTEELLESMRKAVNQHYKCGVGAHVLAARFEALDQALTNGQPLPSDWKPKNG